MSVWSPISLRLALWAGSMLVLIGCQGGSPATPPATPGGPSGDLAAQFAQLPAGQQQELARVWDQVLSGADGRLSLGAYRLRMDLSQGTFQLTAIDRAGNAVQDVTSVLTNPACPNNNCVSFKLNARDAQTGRTSLTLFLYNPSTTKVWDTRFIWTNLQDADRKPDGTFKTDNDVIILNPGGWTNEFDDAGDIPLMAPGMPDYSAFSTIIDDQGSGWPVINPFHTLSSNQVDKSLGGKELALADIEAIVRSDTADVTFIVTTSVGGQREDPFEFGAVVQVGLMDDNINGRTEIRAVIRDHQNDIGFTNPTDPDPTHLGVEFHAPDFFQTSNDEIFQMEYQPPTGADPEGYWFLKIENWQVERAGKYPFYIRAHSDVNPLTMPQSWDLYWKGEILVVRDPSGGGGGGGAPTQDTIAYISTEFGDADIFLNKLQGGAKTNLNGVLDPNENGAEDIDPAFSSPYANPSGFGTKRWIAWASNRGTNGNFRIYVWDLNGQGPLHTYSQPIAVTASLDNCVAPSWSPSNDAIVCQCLDNRGRWAIRKYFIQLDPNDSLPPIIQPPIQLTRNNTGDNTNPSFDRSGNFVVFDSTRIRFDNAEIFVMSDDGENSMLNRITYQAGNDRDPVFASGTGFDQILFQRQTTEGWDIQVASFSAGVYVPPVARTNIIIESVVTNSADDINPAIAPDGRSMLFASNRGTSGAFNLYSVNAGPGGGGETRRTNTDDDEYRPAWGLDIF